MGMLAKMDEGRKRFITEKLEAFRFSMLQDALTLLTLMEINNISADDLRVYVKARVIQADGAEKARSRSSRRGQILMKRMAKITLKCPECGEKMDLRPGSDISNCYWGCKQCRFSLYRHHPIEQEIIKLTSGESP